MNPKDLNFSWVTTNYDCIGFGEKVEILIII